MAGPRARPDRSGAGTSSERLARAAFVAAVVLHLLTLYWPQPVSGGGLLPNADKVVHVGIFAAVALTGLWVRLPVRWLVAVLVVHAVASELVQHALLPDRSGDPVDAVADLVGVGLGAAVGVATARVGGSWLHGRSAGGDRADGASPGRNTGPR